MKPHSRVEVVFLFLSPQMLNVSPRFTGTNCADSTATDSVVLSDLGRRSTVSPDCWDVSLFQFRVGCFAVGVALMVNHILRVIGFCAASQMVGVNADRIIAFKMSYHFIGQVFLRMHCLIHQATCDPRFPGIMNSTVPVFVNPSRPDPTIVRLAYEFVHSVESRARQFCRLIAFVCAVLLISLLRDKRNSASRAVHRAIDLHRFELTFVGAKHPLRRSKGEELAATTMADKSLRRSLAVLLHTNIIAPLTGNVGVCFV